MAKLKKLSLQEIVELQGRVFENSPVPQAAYRLNVGEDPLRAILYDFSGAWAGLHPEGFKVTEEALWRLVYKLTSGSRKNPLRDDIHQLKPGETATFCHVVRDPIGERQDQYTFSFLTSATELLVDVKTERGIIDDKMQNRVYTNPVGMKLMHDEVYRLYNAGRGKKPEGFTVAFMDLDGLKKANNSTGHYHGDQLLRRFGEVVSNATRLDDIIVKMGSDEICILMPESNLTGAIMVANRIIEKLADRSISAKIGLAEFRSDDYERFFPSPTYKKGIRQDEMAAAKKALAYAIKAADLAEQRVKADRENQKSIEKDGHIFYPGESYMAASEQDYKEAHE